MTIAAGAMTAATLPDRLPDRRPMPDETLPNELHPAAEAAATDPAMPATASDATPEAADPVAAAAAGPMSTPEKPHTEADAGAAPAALPAAVPDLSLEDTGARLAELFPALFGAGRMLPIKLRIQADIQQRAPGVFSRKSLSLFLHRHTTRTAYIRALVQASQRFDLDGLAAGEVADEHRAAATAELERRRAIVESRRAAERAARRPPAAPRPTPESSAPAGPATPRGEDAAPARPARRPAPQRPQRPDLPPGPPRARPPHPARQPHPPAQARPPRPEPARRAPPPAPDGPFDAAESHARRERAALLRAWEGTPLTRANFCALKRISEADFEAQLALARREREQRGP